MDVSTARLCLALHSIPGLSDRSLARLFLHYGSAKAIWDSACEDWPSLGVSVEAARSARTFRARYLANGACSSLERQFSSLQQIGAKVLPLTDPRYPMLLHTLYDPPPILYARGNIEPLGQAQLGIVGSRKASAAGTRAARQLSAELVRSGLHICSGLAVGVDGAAHRGALEAGGATIAVMATGLDVVYPGRHGPLAEEICKSGALLTEFPPGAKPLRERFPQRNRIISGLSLGVLVVEAALRSGSLITARTALEQGREVFTLPWSMFHPGGRGCLNLIRDGAKMVQGVEDILEELGPLYRYQRSLQSAEPAVDGGRAVSDGAAAEILRLIGSDVVGVDEIVALSGMLPARVLALLSSLELGGQITRSAGGYAQC